MEKLLQSLLKLFKSKNIDVSNEELINLVADAQPTAPTNLPDMSGINHNAKSFEEMKAYFTAEMNKIEQKRQDEMKVLIEEKKQLESLLTAEKTAREQSQQLIEAKAASEKAEKIAKTIEELKKNPSFPAQNEEMIKTYQKLLETDFDSAIKMIEVLPKTVTNTTIPPPQTQTSTAPTMGLGSGINQKILDYAHGKIDTLN